MAAELLFALDIGTRKVVGMACRCRDNVLVVEQYSIFEHSSRGMIDGQVQDIDEVAEHAQRVKEDLERKVGRKFKRAAIAFAGRSLHSREITATLDFANERFIDAELVEQAGRQAVHDGLVKGLELAMYCVGSVPLGFMLNDTAVRNPRGHYARRLTARVLMTYLPREIVNSKIAVLRRLGLEPGLITLEPIAAGDLVFTDKIKHLNLLLLDIGAGTSDLAVTSGGTVVGYASLPLAGDEITEEISEAYLLDFETAERVKRMLSLEEAVSFTSVFGKPWTVKSTEVIERVRPRIEELATAIAREYAGMYPRPVSAVFCVGGGSFTPGLREALAQAFALAPDRIIIPDCRELDVVDDRTGTLYGPHWMTPLGIALAAGTKHGFMLLEVEVNGELVQMMSQSGTGSALEALGLRGLAVPRTDDAPAPAPPLVFFLNGARREVAAQPPTPAELLLDGQPAPLTATISGGAKLQYRPGEPGREAVLTVAELAEQERAWLDISDQATGARQRWLLPVQINKEPASPDRLLAASDEVTIAPTADLMLALAACGYQPDEFRQREVEYRVGGERRTCLHRGCGVLTEDGQEVPLDQPVAAGTTVVIKHYPELAVKVRELLGELQAPLTGLTIVLNGETLVLPPREVEILMDGKPVTAETAVTAGAQLEVRAPQQQPYVIADLVARLPQANADELKAKRLVLQVNGGVVGFDTPLREYDNVIIRWDERDAPAGS
ncbi:MAG TPA: cell division FtsA domain-containing protein [bacterium]|nr:cell division FtsA domain-containing protein [bacterium]